MRSLIAVAVLVFLGTLLWVVLASGSPVAIEEPECNSELVLTDEVSTGLGTADATYLSHWSFAVLPTNAPCWKDYRPEARALMPDGLTPMATAAPVRLRFTSARQCIKLNPKGKCIKWQ